VPRGPDAALPIALDAMGGDFAPGEQVAGAVAAARDLKLPILLVGRRGPLEAQLRLFKTAGLPITIVDAADVITMHDDSTAVLKRSESSLAVTLRLVAEGKAAAAVSAGHSGAIFVGATVVLKKQAGIERAAFGSVLPTLSGRAIVVDVGANVDCKPRYLQQFGMMGTVYMRQVFKIASPRVGLLSNGAEESKGNALTREAYTLLKTSRLNFIGNIEGNDIAEGRADVVVCDGFDGNLVLKTAEGAASLIGTLLKEELTRDVRGKLAGLLALPAIHRLRRRIDWEEHGGAPILGINGIFINCHGRSRAKAIMNALRQAQLMVDADMIRELGAAMARASSAHRR
jgi:glycerol-3-phosphate acyltransferase PlsX